MKVFIASLNRLLSNNLYELVSINSELTKEYWKVWFYLNSNDAKDQSMKAKCEFLISEVPQLLNLVVSRSKWPEGNFMTVNNMEKITNYLMKIAGSIRYQHRDILEAKTMGLLKHQILTIQKNLRNLVDLVIEKSREKELED